MVSSTIRLSGAEKKADPCPNATAYFAELPNGWASFPTCVARASMLRGLRDRGSLDILESLPLQLRPILDHLRGDAEWLPEIVHVATIVAVRDMRFGEGSRGDAAFFEWLAKVNRELFESPPYVAAVSVLEAADLVPRLPTIWESLHVGVPVTVAMHSPARASAVLAYPRRLFSSLSLESFRRTIAVLLAKTSAAQVHVDVVRQVTGDAARAEFEMTWR
jgi:hypothetical protein